MGELTFYEKHPIYDHIYFHDGIVIPSVTRILSEMNLAFHYADQWYLDFGTAVHKAIEFFEKGTLDESTLDQRVIPRLDAYQKFKEKHGFKPRLIEHMAHSHTFFFVVVWISMAN